MSVFGTSSRQSRMVGAGLFSKTRSRAVYISDRARQLPISTKALPKPQSDLAQQILKSPYNLDFLSLAKEAQERDLERALIAHMRDFLLEWKLAFPLSVSPLKYPFL